MNSKMWNENVHWVIEWLIDWRCRVNAEWILNTPPFLLHCTSGQTTGERCLWLGLEWINHTDVGLMNTTSPHSYYTLALVLHFTFPFPHLNLPPLHLFLSHPSLIVKLSKSVIDLFPSFLFCVSVWFPLSDYRVCVCDSRRLIPPLCRLLIGWSEAVSCQSSACFSTFKLVTSDSSECVNIRKSEGSSKMSGNVWVGNCRIFVLAVWNGSVK